MGFVWLVIFNNSRGGVGVILLDNKVTTEDQPKTTTTA